MLIQASEGYVAGVVAEAVTQTRRGLAQSTVEKLSSASAAALDGCVTGGRRPNRPKMTEAKVRELRQLSESGWSNGKLAMKFGINKTTALRIVKRQYYAQVV